MTAMYWPPSLYRRSVAGSLPASLRLEAVACHAPVLEAELLLIQARLIRVRALYSGST
jgi:hypothetical protein